MLTVVAGGALAQFLTTHVPEWSAGTLLEDLGGAVEFPVYAIIIGLVLNAVLSALGIRGRLAAGFRTEFFIKTGLALLGGTVVLSVIVRAAGAVKAKKEHLAYTATMGIAFELPSISILPWLADLLGLSPAVAGAWIGGNIDTTAAVSAEFLSEADLDGVDSAVKGFRDYFLTLAFVSVGLEFEAKALREAGMKPVAVFAAATLFDIVLGLALATLLFSNFEV